MTDIAGALNICLEEVGAMQRMSSTQSIDLTVPNAAWVVLEGKLDLFSVSSEPGVKSHRQSLFRLEAGQAAIGFPEAATKVVAIPSRGAAVVRLPLEYMWLLLAIGNEAVANVISNWVHAVSANLVFPVAQNALVTLLEPESRLTVTETNRVLSAKTDGLWIWHHSGCSKFLGNSKPVVAQNLAFPLARVAWLESEIGCDIEALTPEEALTRDASLEGLRLFQSAAISLLCEQRALKVGLERERSAVRSASDRTALHRTMLRLASPLRPIGVGSTEVDNCNHPVFKACEAIASRMKFSLKAPPEMRRGIIVPDPLGAIAKASSIRARRVTLKGDWWNYDNGYLLCFREEGNRPIAVLPRSGKKRAELFDPVSEEFSSLTVASAAGLNPSAYVLYKPFPNKSLNSWELCRFALAGCRREISTVICAGAAVGMLGLMVPYATGVVFDQVIPGAERNQLLQISIMLLIVSVASALFSLARGYSVLRLQGRMDSSVQAAVWDRLLSLPVSFFRDYSAGDLAQRSMGIARMRELLTGTTLTAVLSGIFSVFSFAMLFLYSWRLALAATVLVAAASAFSVSCGLVRLRQQRILISMEGRISSILLQFMNGVGKFRVSGTEKRAFGAWGKLFSAQKVTSTRSRRIDNLLTVFNAIFPILCSGIFFYCFEAFPTLKKEITTGDFVAFIAAFNQFLFSILTLSSATITALTVVPLYERAAPILRALPEVNEANTTPGALQGKIELSHVTFTYKADGPPVLRDISLTIEPGQFVAFVGASGSGKSTLLRLLLGFEKPGSGAVYFDGQELTGLDVQSVRRQIGVVLQTSRPISGSIFENIIGSAPLSIEDAWQAARAVGFEPDVKRMPMGMHTLVSEGGGGLSGGQRQRLLIARAIVARPQILMFDEATSALDNRTQEMVTQSLDALRATRIVIAHRLSTIVNADQIFVLDRGSIVQQGTFKELYNQDGLFRTLAARQMV